MCCSALVCWSHIVLFGRAQHACQACGDSVDVLTMWTPVVALSVANLCGALLLRHTAGTSNIVEASAGERLRRQQQLKK